MDVNEEAAQKIYTDQPGRFPKKSSRGNQYIMVLNEVDSDAILGELMKNRTAGEMIRAYQVLIDRLNSAGIFPKHHILDNECSTELKTVIKNNKMTFQLVPPHGQRRNIAEKAIQTFKDHFISILCGDKMLGDVSNNTHLIHVVLSGPTQLVVHSKNLTNYHQCVQ